MSLVALRTELANYANANKAAFFPRFFKTGPGQYGEGDLFMGISVPHCRLVAKQFKTLATSDIVALLHSEWHEERLIALLILGFRYQQASPEEQFQLYTLYLTNSAHINNWDLVDLSCRDIVVHYIYHHPEQQDTLDSLAASDLLWDRRIAIISTFYFLMKGVPEPTLRIAATLLPDKHDLIQKANGWMLRELGKRIDEQLLVQFIKKHYSTMPRTTLRYAIERFPVSIRKQYLAGHFDH